jgi:hypothetical protein
MLPLSAQIPVACIARRPRTIDRHDIGNHPGMPWDPSDPADPNNFHLGKDHYNRLHLPELEQQTQVPAKPLRILGERNTTYLSQSLRQRGLREINRRNQLSTC